MEFSNRSKSSYTMIKLGLILVSRDAGFFNICKSINVIYHINKLKDKSHLIISIDAEKSFDKIQHPFMIKNSPETRHRRNMPQHNEGIYHKTTANVILR